MTVGRSPAPSDSPGATEHLPRVRVAGDDLLVVGRQLGRRPHPMSSVVTRCPWGYPAVVECLPVDDQGRPFSTLYYCTCPTLVVAAGAVESAGGVREWERRSAQQPDLKASLAAAQRFTVQRRSELMGHYGLKWPEHAAVDAGVGGVRRLDSLKCLHAHVAHALARPEYELGRAIMASVSRPWCSDLRCSHDCG